MNEFESIVLNFDDLAVKRQFMSHVGTLRGLYDVRLKPRKRTRSLDQNAYYWAAVVAPFRDWLKEQYGDNAIASEQAHEMLKVKILGLDQKLIEGSQETLILIPRSKTLSVEEFTEYIEKSAAWLAEFCGIIVTSSELFYEGEAPTKGHTFK